MEQTTTCQICARAIKANTGVIAHHGYEQPDRWRGGYGSGWRTGDCFGSRHVPYEVGHDALDWWIERLKIWIPETENTLANHLLIPPAEYKTGPKKPSGERHWEKVVVKPEGFDSAMRPAFFTNWTYEQEFWAATTGIERKIRGMKQELARCEVRRLAWKSPFRSDIPIPA